MESASFHVSRKRISEMKQKEVFGRRVGIQGRKNKSAIDTLIFCEDRKRLEVSALASNAGYRDFFKILK